MFPVCFVTYVPGLYPVASCDEPATWQHGSRHR